LQCRKISATILMISKACCALLLNFKKIQFPRRFMIL
jgi:hypothetical protein